MNRLAYLESLSRRDQEFVRRIDDINFVRAEKTTGKSKVIPDTPPKTFTIRFTVLEPYTELSERAQKLHYLRMLRSVLP